MKNPRKAKPKARKDKQGVYPAGTEKFPHYLSDGSGRIVQSADAILKSSEPKEPQFSVSLRLDQTTLEGKGATVLEALQAIKKPVKITTKSVLTVARGDKSHSRALTIPLAKRLFYPAAQIYHAKNLELLLK